MDHAISSDEDLPDASSIFSAIVPKAKTSFIVRQTAPIVLSDSDEEDAPHKLATSPAIKQKKRLSEEISEIKGAAEVRSFYEHLEISTTNSDILQPVAASPATKRKKRSPEEIAEAKRAAEFKKLQREEEKERKKQERESKAKSKEVEAAKKRFVQEAKRASKPGECLKHLTVMVDGELVRKPCGGRIIGHITEKDVKYEVQSQPHPNLISFLREVSEAKDLPGNRFEVLKKEVVEDQLLIWLPAVEFVEHVRAQCQDRYGAVYNGTLSLRAFIQSLQRKLEDRKVTLLVQGLQKYYKDQTVAKARGNSQQFVSRLDIEETLVDVQFTTSCNIRFTETDEETAKLVFHYTKAIAETPFKQDRCNSNPINIQIETATCVKIDSDGSSMAKAWRQIIQIFRGVGAEVANAIMREYPTPRALYEVYQRCSTEKEGVKLLEDIMVRRGYGVLETSRRVGKELGKKLYILFTTTNPEITLK